MAFKIINITNTLNSKHPNHNTKINIVYNIKFKQYSQALRPNQEAIIPVSDLPLELHKMRMNGFINVIQISDKDYEQTKLKSERFIYGDTRKKIETKVIDSPVQEELDLNEHEYVSEPIDVVETVDTVVNDVEKPKKKKLE
jgi:hypothetical protein